VIYNKAMSMSVTILGSGTCVPSTRRSSPAILIKSESKLLLLDMGAGTLRRLTELARNFNEVDLIFLSHFHPDHCSELIPFLFASNYALSQERNKDLHIIGGPGLNDFYEGLKRVFGRWIVPENYTLHIHEAKGVIPSENFKLKTLPLTHSESSIGLRIESPEGKVLVYSGDTDYCENIIDLAKNADLLILECALPEGMKVEGHLTPSFAGRIARESHCKRLLLTHFYPPCEDHDLSGEAGKEFAGEIILAEDLMEIEV
jgi:ribonuclease BN (tRNA processing enzyme)